MVSFKVLAQNYTNMLVNGLHMVKNKFTTLHSGYCSSPLGDFSLFCFFFYSHYYIFFPPSGNPQTFKRLSAGEQLQTAL